MTLRRAFFFFLSLSFIVSSFLLADGRILEEFTRTYMGNTLPKMTNETWIGQDRMCVKTRRVTIITRYDLKKRWVINTAEKKYFEEALEKAFLEKDNKKAKDYLKDFVVARELKRKSMNETEQNQESEDDLMEGTAVYSEARSLELIKSGYKPFLTREKDLYFLGFKFVDYLLAEKLERLKEASSETLNTKGKCYPFGCFQALHLSRLFPGWQEKFFQEGRFLDRAISEKLNLTQKEKGRVAKRIYGRYLYPLLLIRHGKKIMDRDDTFKMFQERKGRVYIINFKQTQEFPTPKYGGQMYELGLMRMYPKGIEKIQFHDVLLQGTKSPVMIDQLFYVKCIDTEAVPGEKDYELEFSRKEGENIYYDVVFKTKGFTLRAPKVQVKDLPGRVKVTVLAKVEDKSENLRSSPRADAVSSR